MFKVCLFEKIPQVYFDKLQSFTKVYLLKSPAAFDLLPEIAREIQAIIIRAKGKVDKETIDACPNLKIIARYGVGVDNIDLESARKKGIAVLNAREANFIAVAEFTIGLMLALSRKIIQAQIIVKNDKMWEHIDRLIGRNLYGRSVGILGCGKIGSRVAKILASSFNMEVTVYDYKNRSNPEFEGISNIVVTDKLDNIFRESDYITVHLPKKPETDKLVNRKLLELTKDKCMIINTSRGSVVDRDYIMEMLKLGKLGGAALDVFEIEPYHCKEWMFKLPNLIVTPHIAYLTQESIDNTGKIIYEIERELNGKRSNWRVC
jgi:D-3-phosphoglycerate dehydrogenase